MTRYEIRECAFLLLYQQELNDYELSELVETNVESFELVTDKAALSIVNGVTENKSKIDGVIAGYSKSRAITRIPKIILTLLRIAVYEMDYCDNIPAKVAINEAIELSKKYGAGNDSSFISGILGSHYRSTYENNGGDKENG